MNQLTLNPWLNDQPSIMALRIARPRTPRLMLRLVIGVHTTANSLHPYRIRAFMNAL